jgi:hypothetical protein
MTASRKDRTVRPLILAAATALVLAVLAGCGDDPEPTAADPAPGGKKSSRSQPTEKSSEPASPTPSATAAEVTVAAYFVGETPQGPRLYREFRRTEDSGPGLSGLALLEAGPLDTDYLSMWPEGAFTSLGDPEAGVVNLTLADDSFADRPPGMTEVEADLALEQVIYTLQAGFQERLAVQFRIGDGPAESVLGIPASEPLGNGPILETLALVNVTSPEEGATVSGTFTASGVASSFEATVPWQIRQDGQVVADGFATAEGWMDKLYPWQTDVDVSGLAPGEYEFVALTDDPSGGEGGGPHEDSKTIIVE